MGGPPDLLLAQANRMVNLESQRLGLRAQAPIIFYKNFGRLSLRPQHLVFFCFALLLSLSPILGEANVRSEEENKWCVVAVGVGLARLTGKRIGTLVGGSFFYIFSHTRSGKYRENYKRNSWRPPSLLFTSNNHGPQAASGQESTALFRETTDGKEVLQESIRLTSL